MRCPYAENAEADLVGQPRRRLAQAGHRYHRISPLSYTKPVAVHVFQNALLAPALGASGASGGTVYPRCLRPTNDSWRGNQRIYSPPVEQSIDVPNSGYERLADKIALATINKLAKTPEPTPDEHRPVGRGGYVVQGQARTYRTGERHDRD
jgi:hypothetical protein